MERARSFTVLMLQSAEASLSLNNNINRYSLKKKTSYQNIYQNTISNNIPKHTIKAYTQNTLSKHIPKPHIKECFVSTRKQGRIHSPHLICHVRFSFIGPKVLPLHFNLLNFLVPKHEHLFLQYTLRLQLEFSISFHLQNRLVNHMINILNILLK